jgi:hypothetical protein
MKKIIKLNQVEQQNNSGNLQQPLVAFSSIFWTKSQSVTNIITNLAADLEPVLAFFILFLLLKRLITKGDTDINCSKDSMTFSVTTLSITILKCDNQYNDTRC